MAQEWHSLPLWGRWHEVPEEVSVHIDLRLRPDKSARGIDRGPLSSSDKIPSNFAGIHLTLVLLARPSVPKGKTKPRDSRMFKDPDCHVGLTASSQ